MLRTEKYSRNPSSTRVRSSPNPEWRLLQPFLEYDHTEKRGNCRRKCVLCFDNNASRRSPETFSGEPDTKPAEKFSFLFSAEYASAYVKGLSGLGYKVGWLVASLDHVLGYGLHHTA